MKKLVILILSFVPFTAFGANWIEYDTVGNDSTYAYDKSSVKIKQLSNGVKYLQVWEKSNFDNKKYTTKYATNCSSYSISYCNQPYISSKTLYYYDCWNDKINYSKAVYYNSNGDSVDTDNYIVNENSSNNWSDVIPDTVGEGKLKEICRAYKNYLK